MQEVSRIHPLRTVKSFGEIPEDFTKVLPDDNKERASDPQETQDKKSKIQRNGSFMESVETNL